MTRLSVRRFWKKMEGEWQMTRLSGTGSLMLASTMAKARGFAAQLTKNYLETYVRLCMESGIPGMFPCPSGQKGRGEEEKRLHFRQCRGTQK